MKPNGLQAPTWESALDLFVTNKEANCEDATAAFYRSHINILARWAKANDITLPDFSSRDMSAFLVYRKKTPSARGVPVSDRTRHHDGVAAMVFFRFCKAEKLLETNPLREQIVPGFTRKLTRKPTAAEVKRIVKGSKDFYNPSKNPDARFMKEERREELAKRTYAIVSGLVTTAGRIGEMLTLKMADYHPDDLYVTFRDTKTDEDREVPIDADWVAIVDVWLKIRPKNSKSTYLFVNEYGDPMTVPQFDRTFKKIVTFVGLEWCTPHRLRGYSATVLAENSVLGAKAILGHKKIETTMIYAQATKEHMRQVHGEAGLLGGVIEEPEQKPIMKNKRSDEQKRRKLMGR